MDKQLYCITILLLIIAMIRAENFNQNQPIMMDILKMILIDPEFLAMSERNQLRIVESICIFMEKHQMSRGYNQGNLQTS